MATLSGSVFPAHTPEARYAYHARETRSTSMLTLEFAVATLAGLGLFLVGRASPAGILALPAAGLYLWLQTLYFRVDSRAYILMLPMTITNASVVFSLVMIEQGIKIPEIGRFGEAGNYTLQFVFYDALFMLPYLFVYKAWARSTDRASTEGGEVSPRRRLSATLKPIEVPLVIGFVVFCLIAMIGLGLTGGFPLLTGTDRFVFRRGLGNGLFLYILNFKAIIAFILGVAAQISKRRITKIVCNVIMFLLTGVFFLYGDKFFTILTALALFFMPYLYTNARMIASRLPLYLALALAIMAPSFAVTWLIYSNAGRLSSYETLEKLSGRIAGQGELWFVQSKTGAQVIDWNEGLVQNNLQALVEKEANVFALQASIGPNYFSDRYSPRDIAASIHHNAGSVTFTGALEPMGLVMFGWIGLGVVKVICGLLAAVLAAYLAWALATEWIPSATFAMYIMSQFIYTLRQGAPWVLFSTYSMKWLAVIVAIEVALSLVLVSQRSTRLNLRIRNL